jgi:hypothetical protein
VFTLTDNNGCSDGVAIEVASYPFLDVQISAFTNANNGTNGSIELTISGGELPYDILWSTGDTGEMLDGIGQGIYSVTVTDNNGCVSTESQSIIDLDVLELQNTLAVYPNPFTNVISIETTGATSYVVHDLQGRCVAAGAITSNRRSVDASAWPSGMYSLRVQVGGSEKMRRITKL